MKTIQGFGLIIVFVMTILSCSKDKVVPTAAQTNGPTLAGSAGSSKSWKLSSAKYTLNGGTPQTITLSSCVLDNTFIFSNNSTQDFVQNEGGFKCNSADSTVAEKGNWAFTNDGKNLVVEGEWFDDLSQESEFTFDFTSVGESMKVVQLTATAFSVSYSFTYQGNRYIVTVAFTSIA